MSSEAEREAVYWRGLDGQRAIAPPGQYHLGGLYLGRVVRLCMTRLGGRGRVCEVGCGDGRLAGAFPLAAYVGVDINPHSLAAARENRPGYRFQEMLTPDAAWPEADCYLLHTVALHVPDAAIARFLERGRAARMVVVEAMDPAYRGPHGYQRTPEEYRMILGTLGWRKIRAGSWRIPDRPYRQDWIVADW